jgi:K+-transporting ATPase ATPase C chain
MKMFRLLLVLTILCGVIYPLSVTLVGQVLFSDTASGSLLKEGDKIVGSRLLAQKFVRDDFFHSRPSAADYATVASGASQSSPTQKSAKELREKRKAQLPNGGVDAWTTSGSGLDPHISPKTAKAQVKRVALARGVSSSSLHAMVNQFTEGPTLGIWGQPRVNVLELNMALSKGNNGDSRSTFGNP